MASEHSRVSEDEDFDPSGLRVLVVDDDHTTLKILEKMLKRCNYTVTSTSRGDDALSLLRGNSSQFDLVISDVHMPDMDGFKLLELIGLELDLPVIMMSSNGETSSVLKGITHGACDYLLKPVRIEELRNIWQHVVRRKTTVKESAIVTAKVDDEEGGGGSARKEADCSQGKGEAEESSAVSKKKREKVDGQSDQFDDPLSNKKPRVVWSVELHQRFVNAVNKIGLERAVPKKILEVMNVQGLTRENVASHLQKYRLYLRRLSGVELSGDVLAALQADHTMGSNLGMAFAMANMVGSDLSMAGSTPPHLLGSSVNPQATLGRELNLLGGEIGMGGADLGNLAAITGIQSLQQHTGNSALFGNNAVSRDLLLGSSGLGSDAILQGVSAADINSLLGSQQWQGQQRSQAADLASVLGGIYAAGNSNTVADPAFNFSTSVAPYFHQLHQLQQASAPAMEATENGYNSRAAAAASEINFPGVTSTNVMSSNYSESAQLLLRQLLGDQAGSQQKYESGGRQ